MNLTHQEFEVLRRLIQRWCGIWLGDDKHYLILSRLEPVVHHFKLNSYAELITQLSTGNATKLSDSIVEAITTNETSFNRDSHPFEELRRALLPELIQSRMKRQNASGGLFGKIRVWSAAASTGQEAYSIAIAILGYIELQQRNQSDRLIVGVENFSILASDVSNDALKIAKEGKYKRWEIDRGLSAEARGKYFVECDGGFQVHPMLKSMIDFQRINLVQPQADMSPFDMIFCRNLLIYFDEATRKSVLENLIKRLSPGGVMILGAAESLHSIPLGIVQEQRAKTMLYRKRAST